MQELPQFAGALEFFLEDCGRNAVSGTCNLNVCPSRPRTCAQQDWQPDNSINSDHAYLDGISVCHTGDHRCDAVFHEVAVIGFSVQQGLLRPERYRRETGGQVAEFGFGQGG